MNCPRCKLGLKPSEYESVTIQGCAKCGGTWVEPGGLQSIVKTHEKTFTSQLIQKTLKEAHTGIPKAEIAAGALVPCPQCSAAMHALNYDYGSGVIVNVCSTGHGLWFDRDELEEVQIFMEHWDQEEKDHHAQWTGMARKAEQDQYADFDKDEARIQKDLRPVGGLIDSIFYHFEKQGRRK